MKKLSQYKVQLESLDSLDSLVGSFELFIELFILFYSFGSCCILLYLVVFVCLCQFCSHFGLVLAAYRHSECIPGLGS